MNNVIKLAVAGVLAFMGCSDDKSAGAAIEPNTVAENSSSSVVANVSSSSDAVNISSSTDVVNSSSAAMPSIEFNTEPTTVLSVSQGEVSVYAAENGAEASCSVGQKVYTLRFIINENRSMQKMLYLDNFGSDCDSILNLFKLSCTRGIWDFAWGPTCLGNGRLKASCYINEIDSLRMCITPGCSSVSSDSVMDFDAIVSKFIQESDSLCGDIPVGPGASDSVDNRPELPSDSVVGIDTAAKRLFIIKPNVDTVAFSESERPFMDSLAWSYRSKSRRDEYTGEAIWVHNYAQYEWTTPKEEYFVKGSSSLNRCNVDLYSEERGLVRYFDIFTTLTFDGVANLESTILYMDSIIVYLAYGNIGSSALMVKDIFQAECEATAGIFVDNFVFKSEIPISVALTCVAKNYSGMTFESIVGQQRDLCKNEYQFFAEPK